MRLLEVENLRKYYFLEYGLFPRKRKEIRAVDGVSFSIEEGKTFSLVGESGCGKTTIARTIVKLEKPTSGRIIYRGRDIYSMDKEEERKYRKEVQMIFQDPHSSLDPRMTAGDTVEEALIVAGYKNDREARVKELFEIVGLEEELMERYPHELSGGQKQRVGIARALAVNPRLIIADEPVSALDISVQAQILNLMVDLKEKYNLSYLFIAHNLPVIRYISDRVAVIFMGKIVEMADAEELFDNPLHPYTKLLLELSPSIEKKAKRRYKLRVENRTAKGCRFYHSCPESESKCFEVEPELLEVKKEHLLACWRFRNI